MGITTAILKGTLYLKKKGSTQRLSTGNATKIALQQNIVEKSMVNTQTLGGGNHDAFKQPDSVKLSIQFRNLLVPVAEIAFGGTVTDITGGAVTDEAHADIVLDSLIVTAKRQDLALAMTVKKGAVVLVEGTDYQRKRAGIIPLSTGSLIAGDDITISYTALAVKRIDGLMSTATEYEGIFDGANERSGKPAFGTMYRLSFGPATNIELVSEGGDYISFDCEAELLADDSKPANQSPFYHFEIGGIE